MQTRQAGLGNLQLELLKLYSNYISDKYLFDIKLMLSNYFAQKATEAMDRVWEEDNLTEQDMINWTNTKSADCVITNDGHFQVLKQIDFPKVEVLTVLEFEMKYKNQLMN